MASYNRVILMGNLTRDPDMRVTPGGTSICKFSVAVSRQFAGQDGNQREETTFVDVDSFGKQAEVISKFFGKGKPILVEGRLRQDQWETKEGEKRSKLVVVLERFEFVGSAGGRGEGGESGGRGGDYEEHTPPPRRQAPKSGGHSAPPPPSRQDLDEDVPF